MNDRTETLRFDDVRRRLQPGDVFHRADHDWKTQSDRRWKGGCPWHESSSGACFSVNPETLEWHCFHCERGGGPLEYVAELESIGGGARETLRGQDFFRAWKALSRHAGCEGPPELNEDGAGRTKESDRRPLRKNANSARLRKKARTPQKVEGTSKKAVGDGAMSRDIPPRGKPAKPTLDVPERELREALVRYREALFESEKARAYVEGRGLSVETLRAYGCGFAPAGEWIGSDNAPRLVTPHTTAPGESPDGRPKLVNLSGRYLGQCPAGKRHRHIGGNPTALFNASAIAKGSGPLVICEGPMDALSFIEAGHERAIATHGKHGPPWKALRGNVSAVVFAFDRDDEDAKEKAVEYALDARRLNYEAHVLHDEATYAGHGDPNEALQAGELSLDYLRAEVGAGIENPMASDNPMDGRNSENPDGGDPTGLRNNLMTPPPESREAPANEDSTGAAQSPTSQPAGGDGGNEGHTAADLVEYWNRDDIGYLGRWIWERSPAPIGDAGVGLYADRALHKWIAEKLQAGPHGTSEQDRIRLRWVLWQLYAAFGPEDVPDRQIPIPPTRRK